jgi:hypothetical protein
MDVTMRLTVTVKSIMKLTLEMISILIVTTMDLI